MKITAWKILALSVILTVIVYASLIIWTGWEITYELLTSAIFIQVFIFTNFLGAYYIATAVSMFKDRSKRK